MSADPPATDLDRVGGSARVAALMETFVARVAADPIVGFFFHGRDLARIARHEAELATAHLGGRGELGYGGRPIGAVHRPLRINRGHFRRRLFVLRRVLEAEGVDPGVVARWLAHDAALEPVVAEVRDCVPGETEP